MERLKELKGDIYKCIHCKACRFAFSGEPDREGIGEHKDMLYEGMVQACPAGIEYGWEAYWNAGKVWIARAILDGELDIKENAEDIAEVVFPCITCGMCSSQCENDIRTVDIIEALRDAVLEAGASKRDKHAWVEKSNAAEDNPYGAKKVDRANWAKESGLADNINKDTKIAYYVGCTASYRQTNIAEATMKLLKKIGYDITILDDESCCGSPFFRTGLIDEATRTMNHNLEIYEKFDYLMFSCAGCYRTFTIDYPKWTKKPNKFKTIHAMELVSKLITLGKIKLKEVPELKGKKVTYHDPCHTGRHYGEWFKERIIKESKNLMMDKRAINKVIDEWFEVPRTIIKALPGVEFNEMYRIKMDSFCCGAGGGVRAQYPEFSLKTASLRMDEANAVEADFMLTECPFCWRNLYDANEKYEHNVPVMTILEMINKYDMIEDAEMIPVEDALRDNNAEKYFPSNQRKLKKKKKK